MRGFGTFQSLLLICLLNCIGKGSASLAFSIRACVNVMFSIIRLKSGGVVHGKFDKLILRRFHRGDRNVDVIEYLSQKDIEVFFNPLTCRWPV